MTDLQKALYEVAIDLSLWMKTVGTVTSDKPHLYNIGTRLHDSLDELANACAEGEDDYELSQTDTTSQEVPTSSDTDGWIPNTGKMPVAYDVMVDVLFANGTIRSGWTAGSFLWGIYAGGSSIGLWRLHDPNRPDQVQTEQNAPKPDSSGYSRNLVEQMYNALMLAIEYLDHEHTAYDSICPACTVEQAIETYEAEANDQPNEQLDIKATLQETDHD